MRLQVGQAAEDTHLHSLPRNISVLSLRQKQCECVCNSVAHLSHERRTSDAWRVGKNTAMHVLVGPADHKPKTNLGARSVSQSGNLANAFWIKGNRISGRLSGLMSRIILTCLHSGLRNRSSCRCVLVLRTCYHYFAYSLLKCSDWLRWSFQRPQLIDSAVIRLVFYKTCFEKSTSAEFP